MCRSGDAAQLVERLPSMHMVLGPKLSTMNTKSAHLHCCCADAEEGQKSKVIFSYMTSLGYMRPRLNK